MCLLQCLRFAPFEITSVFVFEIVEKRNDFVGKGGRRKKCELDVLLFYSVAGDTRIYS